MRSRRMVDRPTVHNRSGDTIFVKTIENDDAVEMSQPLTMPTIGRIIFKFVALLTLIVTALALAWSR